MLKNSGSYLHDNPANGFSVRGDIEVTSWESHFVVVMIDGQDFSGFGSKLKENVTDAELLKAEEKRE